MEDVEYLEEYEELILSPHHNFEDNIIEEITDGYALGMEQPSFMEDVATIGGTVPYREYVGSVTESFSNDEYKQKQTGNSTEYCDDFQNTDLHNYDVNEDALTKKRRKKRRIKNLDALSSDDELNDTNSSTPFPPQKRKNQPQIKGILVGGHSKKEPVIKNISLLKTGGELNDVQEEERELPFKIFKNKATGEVVKKGQVRLIRKSDLADSKTDSSSKAINETKTDYSPIIDQLKMKKSGDQGINRKAENVAQNNTTKEFTTITEVKRKPKPKIVPLKSEPTDAERRLWSLKSDSRQAPCRRKSQEFDRDKIKIQPQRRKSQYILPSEFSVTIDDRKKLQENPKPVIQRRKSQYTSPAELALEDKQKKITEKEMASSYFKVKSQALLVTEKRKPNVNPPRSKSQQSKQLISNQTSTKRSYTEVSLNEIERTEESEPAKKRRVQITVKNVLTKNETKKSNITTQQLGSESIKQNIKSPINELNKIKHETTKSISKNPSEMEKIKDIISKSFGVDSLKSNNQKKVLKQNLSMSSKEKPNAQISFTKYETNKEKPKEIKEDEYKSDKPEVKQNDTKHMASKELPKFPSKTAPELQQDVDVNKKVQESSENVRKKIGRPSNSKYSVQIKNANFDKILKSIQGRVASVRINRRFVTRYLEARQFPHEKRKEMMAMMKKSLANSITSERKIDSPSSQTLSDGLKRVVRKKKDIAESVVIAEVHNIPEFPLKDDESKGENDKATLKIVQVQSESTSLENYFKNQVEYGNCNLQNKFEQKTTTKSPTTTKSKTITKTLRQKSAVDHNENIEESSLEAKLSLSPVGIKQRKACPGKLKVSPSLEINRAVKDLQSSEHLYKSIIDLIPIPQNLIVETRLLTTEEFKQKTSLHSIARAQARLAQQKDLQNTLAKKVASDTNSNLKKLLPESQPSTNSEEKQSTTDSQPASTSSSELANKLTSLTNTIKPMEPRGNNAIGRGVTVKFFLDKVEDLLNEHVAQEIKREIQEISKNVPKQNQFFSSNRSLLKRNRADDSKCDPHTAKFMYEFLRELFSKNKYKSSTASGQASNKQKSGILYIDRTKVSTPNTIQAKSNDRPHFGNIAETSNVQSKKTTSSKPPVAVGNYDAANISKDVNISSEKKDPQLPEFHFRKIVLPTKNEIISNYKSLMKMKTDRKTSKIVKPNQTTRGVATTKKGLHPKEKSKPKSMQTTSKNLPTAEFLGTNFPNITFRPLKRESRSPEIITPDSYIPPKSDSEEDEEINTNSSDASRENTGIIMEDVHKSKVRLPASRNSPLPSKDTSSGGGASTKVDASQKPDYHVVVTRTFKKILLPMDPISASDVSPENAVLPIIVNAQSFNSDTLNHQNPSSSRNTDRDPLVSNDTVKEADTTDTFYSEDYSLDTGYQFKCDKCSIILSSRPLIQDHVQRVHFRFTNNCYLCKAQLDQSDQLQHFLNNHATAAISK